MSATRPHLVGVRLSADEFAALTDASARTGKTAATLLRDTFLIGDAHMLKPADPDATRAQGAAACDWRGDHANCCIARAREAGVAAGRAEEYARIRDRAIAMYGHNRGPRWFADLLGASEVDMRIGSAAAAERAKWLAHGAFADIEKHPDTTDPGDWAEYAGNLRARLTVLRQDLLDGKP